VAHRRVSAHGSSTSSTATGEGPHAFIWRDGEMTDLGVPPGGALPFPEALNDHDQVVGSYFRPEDRTRHAFLWQDGRMIDLGALAGAEASEATDINDQGQISGFVSTDEDGDGFHETSRPVTWTVRRSTTAPSR